MVRIVFAAALAVITWMPAHAQNASPDSENGRYTFHQAPEGLLRLDSRTGQVSLCSKRAAGWACQTVPDERTALETEISRLQGENAALKKEMIARGIALPGGLTASERPGGKSDEVLLKLPNDADLERVMTFFEKVWRRLIGMVQSMHKEMEKKG